MTSPRPTVTGTAVVAVLFGVLGMARDESQLLNFKQWARAVSSHQPGVSDDALAVVWKMREDDRRYTSEKLRQVLADFDGTEIAPPGSEPDQLARFVEDLSLTLTPKEFLERAAILHADAVMFDRRPPPAADAPEEEPRSRLTISGPGIGIVAAPQRAPQSDRPFAVAVDGEVSGFVAQNWNWPFARFLVDQLRSGRADAFVSTWYHATTAFLLRRGDLAEAAAHLDHASQRLSHDARIDFDRGCLAEDLAMHAVQQAAVDDGSAGVTNRHAAARWVAEGHARLPSPEASNAQALEFFRQALGIDPHLVEARVRAARLLEVEGHFGEARQQLLRALADQPMESVTAFYADLFSARAAAALGQDDEASARVQSALGLFPSADSAILAASQLAFQRSDSSAAARHLDGLDDRTASVDPWRDYIYGPGRALDIVLRELWQSVPVREVR